jgi:hypothetical protein
VGDVGDLPLVFKASEAHHRTQEALQTSSGASRMIEPLARAAIAAGLAGHDRRDLLLAGYPKAWVATLPEKQRPDDQVRSDLIQLHNGPGLGPWLTCAAALVPGVAAFEEALRALGLPIPSAAPAPGAPIQIKQDVVEGGATGVEVGLGPRAAVAIEQGVVRGKGTTGVIIR